MTIPSLLLIVTVFAAGTPTARLVEDHLRQYPRIQVQDVYKLLYQGEFGVGHLLGSSGHARRYLMEELGSMDTLVLGEPLFESVSADGQIVRVNLRPFKRLGYSPDSLLQAMIVSAAQTPGDTTRFLAAWQEFVASADTSAFRPDDLRAWDERVRRGDLRVVHHSPEYMEAYQPAYRVCRRPVIEAMLASGGGGNP